MQQPQLLGIFFGVVCILAGYISRNWLLKRKKQTLAGVLFVISLFLGGAAILQNLLYSYTSTWSWRGVLMIWGDMFGAALAPIILGCLGLLYKPNRVAGYTIALIVFFLLILLGST